MGPKSNQDYYRLSSNDRLLCISGVPISYLKKKIDTSKFSFSQVSQQFGDRVIVIQPPRQKEFFTTVMTNITTLGSSGFYAIGATPVEGPAYELATVLTREYYLTRVSEGIVPNIKWIDLGAPDWNYLKDDDDNPSLVVVHGINDHSEGRRFELAKDFIRRSSQATCILVGVTQNILTFTSDKINIQPDIVWQLGRTVHRSI